MYLSSLLIDTGDNPDRPRPGRLWLRNLYHVHQRLCMAFPSDPRKKNDPEFLEPFKPGDFPEIRNLADQKKSTVGQDTLKQVHAQRNEATGFLFRIDPLPNGRAAILVQAAVKPDWDYAFHNANHFLASPPEVKQLQLCFKQGQQLRFRLVANPTKRLSPRSLGADGNPIDKGIGKRVPVPADSLFEWLDRRAQSAGFSINKDAIVVQPGYVFINKEGKGQGKRLRSVRYDGILTVKDSIIFNDILIRGIGSGKAFGFGLLSVIPVGFARSEDSI